MSFAFFWVYLVVTFLRPGEQIAELREYAVMDIVSALALTGAMLALVSGRGPTLRSVQLLLLIALWTWALLSVMLSPARSPETLERVIGFGKSSGVAFLLVALNVVTIKRLRIVAATLSVLGLLVGLQAAVGHHIGWGTTPMGTGTPAPPQSSLGMDVLPPGSDLEPTQPERPVARQRIRGVGLFGDPNDLAVTLISVLPLCLALRRPGARFSNAIPGLDTHRGHLIQHFPHALARRPDRPRGCRHAYGSPSFRTPALGRDRRSGGHGIPGAGFLGGRTMQLDQSAMGRIWAWSDGLQMLKSSPVWGIGYGMFTTTHTRAAHSSFVECTAELGLVGYVLWLGLSVITLDELRDVAALDPTRHPDLPRWGRALSHSLGGALVGGLFLSRAYDVTFFVLIALGAALADVARRQGLLPQPTLLWRIVLVLGAAVSSIVAIWIYMRLV